MITSNLTQTVNAWSSLSDSLFVPHTEAEYQKLVMILDELIDVVGEDENHPLASLIVPQGYSVQLLVL